jgi:hypothetical protein
VDRDVDTGGMKTSWKEESVVTVFVLVSKR